MTAIPLKAGEPVADRNLLEWTVTFMSEAHGWSKESVAHALGYTAQSGIYHILKQTDNRPLPEGRGPRLLKLLALAQRPGKLDPPHDKVDIGLDLAHYVEHAAPSTDAPAKPTPPPAPAQKPSGRTDSMLDLLHNTQHGLEQVAMQLQARVEAGECYPWQAPGLLEGARRVRSLKAFFDAG